MNQESSSPMSQDQTIQRSMAFYIQHLEDKIVDIRTIFQEREKTMVERIDSNSQLIKNFRVEVDSKTFKIGVQAQKINDLMQLCIDNGINIKSFEEKA